MKYVNERDARLEYEISELEVNKAIDSLYLRKWLGVDTVQAKHQKYGGNEVTLYLSRLFNGIITVG